MVKTLINVIGNPSSALLKEVLYDENDRTSDLFYDFEQELEGENLKVRLHRPANNVKNLMLIATFKQVTLTNIQSVVKEIASWLDINDQERFNLWAIFCEGCPFLLYGYEEIIAEYAPALILNGTHIKRDYELKVPTKYINQIKSLRFDLRRALNEYAAALLYVSNMEEDLIARFVRFETKPDLDYILASLAIVIGALGLDNTATEEEKEEEEEEEKEEPKNK